MIKSFLFLLWAGFLSLGWADGSQECQKVLRRVGVEAVAERLAKDPVALLKGRDTTISEGLLFKKWDSRLKTTFYHTASDPDASGNSPLVDPKSKAVALFFHGSGTAKSSGRNFIHNMNWLSQQGISGVAIDLPFHASNKGEARLNNRAEFIKWLREVVAEVKKSGKPIYLVGHSFGPEVALQFASEYPKDLNGGGLFLISGAWGKSPSHEWMYEKVTTPGMEYIGGDQKVEDNPAGGDWAGQMATQSDWHVRGIAPNVRVKLVVGEKDEWWPSPSSGEKLPSGVTRVKPALPYPNQLGNAGLIKKLGVTPEFSFKDAIGWTQEKIPQVEIDVVEGYGHFIFDSRDQRGGPLLNRLLLDFAGVEYSKAAEQNKKTARLEMAVLAENNKVFRDWLGEQNLAKMLKSESSAERVLEQWKTLEFLAWKKVLSSMEETDPNYYESRKYWLAKELKEMPADAEEFKRRGWNANEMLSDIKRHREAMEKGQSSTLSEDPYRPKLPALSVTLLGEQAQTTPHSGSLLNSEFRKSLEGKGSIQREEEIAPGFKRITFDYKGNKDKTWVVMDSDNPQKVSDFLQRAYEQAYRNNGFISPGDNWEAEVDGIRVKATNRLDHKNKTYRLERVVLEAVKD
ncbi:MAG: alpha/beta hydrolase [Pseudomonadota bacterium]